MEDFLEQHRKNDRLTKMLDEVLPFFKTPAELSVLSDEVKRWWAARQEDIEFFRHREEVRIRALKKLTDEDREVLRGTHF